MSDHNQKRMLLEAGLRNALAEQELSVFYQPKVCISSNKIVGFEALCRWTNDTLGMVSPMTFIPVAEELGIIASIDYFVLNQACQQAKTWHDQGYPVQISVNLSGLNVNDNELIDTVDRALVESGLAAEFLELEITEGVLVEFGPEQLEVMNRLVKLGVKLAIDDFGTGYSSLSYLKQLPIRTLKIDRSFIKHMDQDRKDQVLVSSIINMAQSLDLSVVAEGVENNSQFLLLKKQNCNISQGYLCSPPVPADQAFALIQTDSDDRSSNQPSV